MKSVQTIQTNTSDSLGGSVTILHTPAVSTDDRRAYQYNDRSGKNSEILGEKHGQNHERRDAHHFYSDVPKSDLLDKIQGAVTHYEEEPKANELHSHSNNLSVVCAEVSQTKKANIEKIETTYDKVPKDTDDLKLNNELPIYAHVPKDDTNDEIRTGDNFEIPAYASVRKETKITSRHAVIERCTGCRY